MGPPAMYLTSGTGLESTGHFAHGWIVEAYLSLGPEVRAGLQFAGTLVVALVLLGMTQGHGSRAVAKSRRSPIISFVIGLPALSVVMLLSSTGYLILGSSLGTFFGIILVVLGLATAPAAIVIGSAAVGQSVMTRLGRDQLWIGVLAGSLISGLAGLWLPATIAFIGLVATVGMGAGVRILFGAGESTSPDERTVPPANKI
ncbi:hypothetical protein ACLI4Z_14390 [Natrialbaceae archaeon A-arb3/5]